MGDDKKPLSTVITEKSYGDVIEFVCNTLDGDPPPSDVDQAYLQGVMSDLDWAHGVTDEHPLKEFEFGASDCRDQV